MGPAVQRNPWRAQRQPGDQPDHPRRVRRRAERHGRRLGRGDPALDYAHRNEQRRLLRRAPPRRRLGAEQLDDGQPGRAHRRGGRQHLFALKAPAPNPLRAGQTAQLTFHAPEGAEVEAALYNSLGQQVRTLDASGGSRLLVEAEGLSSGLYFVRLTAGEHTATQPLTLVR
ncbi:MAG: hypothetical protein BRD37_02060 [Bacteroidetes bacterium QH_8_67_23]|nr:MAG: hypothetical protein BRD37_02060 [Bacteroidetes bacterium QH_8_67_23]